MKLKNILFSKQEEVLDDLLARCVTVKPTINIETIKPLALDAVRATNLKQPLPDKLNILLEKWYNSVASGTPDYTVYSEDEYIAELWACWKVYSRTHLLNIQKPKCLSTGSITAAHSGSSKIVDLGCGFAYTTAAIKQIFPDATVYGTNIDSTLQMSVAKTMAADYGFSMAVDPNSIAGPTDLVFASEYFEHFDRPLEHLDQVIDALQPRAMLIANAFGPTAIGHFREYIVYLDDTFPAVPAEQTGKMFNERMKHHGYTKIKTKLWNNRPAYWIK